MNIDSKALLEPASRKATIRFFEWNEPCVTYGYLLDEELVLSWAASQGLKSAVQRPTGGGAVVHHPNDLALSIIWSRGSGFFPDRPKDAYREIHSLILRALQGPELAALYLQGACADSGLTPKPMANVRRFSACFKEPVCNDVMQDGVKIVGGALRLTRNYVLYQGDIHLEEGRNKEDLRQALSQELTAAKVY